MSLQFLDMIKPSNKVNLISQIGETLTNWGIEEPCKKMIEIT